MTRLLNASAIALILGFGAVAGVAPPARAQIGLAVTVGFAPPPIPVYVQPPIPGYGYVWTPGYWGWDSGFQDYYWVPGAWVQPPGVGLLWTPGWWGWNSGDYVFNAGYWGPSVGFYGGVDYGYGYWGHGYGGGYWNGDRFYYNRAVDNLDGARIRTVYSHGFGGRTQSGGASFNGGPGGVRAAPRAGEMAAARQAHVASTTAQLRQEQLARSSPALRASVNHGRPSIAATAHAGDFRGRAVSGATSAASWRRPAGAGVRVGSGVSRTARTVQSHGVAAAAGHATHGAVHSRHGYQTRHVTTHATFHRGGTRASGSRASASHAYGGGRSHGAPTYHGSSHLGGMARPFSGGGGRASFGGAQRGGGAMMRAAPSHAGGFGGGGHGGGGGHAGGGGHPAGPRGR